MSVVEVQHLQARIAELEEALRPFARHVDKRGETITLKWGASTYTGTLKPEDFYRASDLLIPEHIKRKLENRP